MANEEMNTPATEETELDYIDQVKQLRESTVPKEQYEKLKEENKKLFRTLIEGGQIQNNTTTTKSIPELRKELLCNENLNNLQYCQKALELRDAIIADGGTDPFLPYGMKITPTREDIEAAERLADVLKNTIDYAQGDSQLFTAELQRVTRDARR